MVSSLSSLGYMMENLLVFIYKFQYQPHCIISQEQRDLQFPLHPDDYPFLNHISFLCASDIEQYPYEDLLKAYEHKEIKVISQLKTEHMLQILKACRTSRVISNIDKKRFLSD